MARTISIAVFILTLLCLSPLFTGLYISFGGAGVAYGQWFANWRGWRLLLESFAFAAGGATGVFALAFCVAMWASRLGRTYAIIVLTLCALPLLTPASLYATSWIMALGRAGVITTLLKQTLGITTPTVYDKPVAACITGLRYLAPCIAILMIALRRCHQDKPVSTVFRVPLMSRWRRITLPRIAASATIAWLIVFVLVANDPIVPAMFLIPTYSGRIVMQYNALLDPAGAAALAAPAAALGLVATLLTLHLSRTWRTGQPSLSRTIHRLKRSHHLPVNCLFIAFLASLMLVPIVALAVRAGWTIPLSVVFGQAQEELYHTIVLMLVGGSICTLTGLFLAESWHAARANGQPSLVPLTLVNLFVPPALLGIGILTMFHAVPLQWLRDSDAPLILGYVARWTPLVTLMLMAENRQSLRQANLSATIHQVPRWTQFTRITLHKRLPGLALAWIVSALLIAIELELSVLLVQPGSGTLGVRLYTMVHTAPDALVSALARDIVLLTAPLLALLGVVTVRMHRKYIPS